MVILSLSGYEDRREGRAAVIGSVAVGDVVYFTRQQLKGKINLYITVPTDKGRGLCK